MKPLRHPDEQDSFLLVLRLLGELGHASLYAHPEIKGKRRLTCASVSCDSLSMTSTLRLKKSVQHEKHGPEHDCNECIAKWPTPDEQLAQWNAAAEENEKKVKQLWVEIRGGGR